MVWFVHLGTPCKGWSVARTTGKHSKTVKLSYDTVRFTVRVIRACHRSGVKFSLENPLSSRIWKHPQIEKVLKTCRATAVDFDCCQYGCSFLKPTRIVTNESWLGALSRRCSGGHVHERLQGLVEVPSDEQRGKWCWTWKTSLAGAYSPALCRSWARLLSEVAPRTAWRCIQEPRISEHWEKELRSARGALEYRDPRPPDRLPRSWKSPWSGARRCWGTGDTCRAPCSCSSGRTPGTRR